MSFALGKRILPHICGRNNAKFRFKVITTRWWSTAAEEKTASEKLAKNVIPAPEPGKIQAAVLKNFNEPLQIENVEIPQILEPKEVLVDVHYCALNGSDMLLTENSYRYEPKLPQILGYEIVGELMGVGEEAAKNGYKIGDKVIALNKERHGGFAETCTAEFGDIWKVPSNVKLIDAACLLDSYITALIGLEERACLEDDEMVLVNIGLGGVGLAAVDLATHIFKAQVIGVSATENITTLVREMGAFSSLKYHDKKLMKQIVNIAAEKDIKEIFDGVSGENFKKVLSCFTDVYKSGLARDLLRDEEFSVVVQHLSREGRFIIAGLTVPKFGENDTVQTDSFSVSGVSLTEYRKKNHELYRSAADDVMEYFEEGLILPTRSLVAGLYKISNAMQFITDMKASGKVIIDLKNKEVFKETAK